MFKSIPLLLAIFLAFTTLSMAEKSAKEIDNDANEALIEFYQEVNGGKKFLENAKGYVIFPDVKEAGFGIGGRYGEGVLRVGNVSKGYYSITSASVGFQMGAQTYSLIIALTSEAALNKFITDDDWETEVDVNIAMAEWNAEEEAARWVKANMTKPVVGFIGGRTAPPGKRMGHAGAIISGGKGTADEKIRVMNECGIKVADTPSVIGETLISVLKEKGIYEVSQTN